MTAQIIIHFHVHGNGLGRDAVGLADGCVRFKKAQAILELDIERVFPAEIAGVADARERALAVGFLELHAAPDFAHEPKNKTANMLGESLNLAGANEVIRRDT